MSEVQMKLEELKNYNAVALCGYRNKGRVLLKDMRKKEVNIVYIIERNYEALRELEKKVKIPIVGFGEEQQYYKKADIILLSGDLPELIVQDCLQMAGIDVPILKIEME